MIYEVSGKDVIMGIFSIKNKNVLISGASGDIGAALSLVFARNGANLALLGHSNMETLKTHAFELRKNFSVNVFCRQTDIADPVSVRNSVSDISDNFGKIDILINNAGISFFGLDQDVTPETWRKICDVNLSGTMYLCRELIPSMLSGGGRIINVSSMWGNLGASCEAAYSASKGGINAYTRALAKELAPSRIPVNAVALGAIDTKMNARLSPEEKAEFEESIPYRRMATPEEAAEMIFLIASAPDYLTGQVIGFDGAF